MKKIFLIFVATVMLSSVVWADKSRFYEGGKVIDTMYVDSEDGLRVRDFPSLKSARLCALPHRLPVKVVALGAEATIDGITAPWVEILIPRYEWQGEEPEYGWVFGGYLSEELPIFQPPKNASELEQYLGFIETFDEYENKSGQYYKFIIYESGSYWRGKNGSPKIGVGGKWNVISNNKILFFPDYFYGDDDDKRTLTFVFEDDGSFHYSNGKVTKYCYSTFSNSYVFLYHITKRLYHTSRNGNFLTYCANLDDWRGYHHTREETIFELIKFGFSAKGTEYEREYHDYWNPIMQEHQKKADAGR